MIGTIIESLHWIGLAGAAAAIVIYFVQIALRPKAVRLITGAGLFFTGLGLAGTASVLPRLPADMDFVGAVATVALMTAVYFQGAASLRGRRGDRRADRPHAAEAAEPAEAVAG